MKLSELIQDCNQKLSARKLSFLFWSFSVLFIWIYLSYVNNQMAEINDGIKWIFGILGGTYLGGNYLEKNKIESK